MIIGTLCILIGFIGILISWFIFKDQVCKVYNIECISENQGLILTTTGKVMISISCIIILIGGILVFKPRLDLLI